MKKFVTVLGVSIMLLGFSITAQAQSKQLLRSAFKVLVSTGTMTTAMHFILEYDETKDSLQMVKTEIAELRKMNIDTRQIKTIDLTKNPEDRIAAKVLYNKGSIAKIGTAFKIPTQTIKASQLGKLKGIPVNQVLKEYQLVKPVTIKDIREENNPKKSLWQAIKDEFFTWKGIGLIVLIFLFRWLSS